MSGPTLEISPSRTAKVGDAEVRRALPQHSRRTVGAWCFADHFGPVVAAHGGGMDIGPHPHIGLQTVTWLIAGELVHHDSLGSEQLIRPGQLNLMTAGRGIAHAEETPGTSRGSMHGLQLWVALPEQTRAGPAAFEHHAELPRVEIDRAEVTVLVGAFAGARSRARTDTVLVGIEVDVRAGRTTLPLDPAFEHAVIVAEGSLALDGETVGPGHLAYLGSGRDELTVDAAERARALVLGGEPFAEPILMWWNFVARTRDEMDDAIAAWTTESDRFAPVVSALDRIPAPRPYWATP